MEDIRTIKVYGEYFWAFYNKQSLNVQKKFIYVFKLIRVSDVIPVTFIKQVRSVKGLYEIRVEAESNIYRVFCCFDEDRLIVLFNVFQKKTQKTPAGEIAKAERLMKKYYKEKGE